jgi:hypothetical protein
VAEPREHGAALEQQAAAEPAVRDIAALCCLVDGLAIDVEKLGDLIGRHDHRGIVHDTHARHACDLGEFSATALAGSRVEAPLSASPVERDNAGIVARGKKIDVPLDRASLSVDGVIAALDSVLAILAEETSTDTKLTLALADIDPAVRVQGTYDEIVIALRDLRHPRALTVQLAGQVEGKATALALVQIVWLTRSVSVSCNRATDDEATRAAHRLVSCFEIESFGASDQAPRARFDALAAEFRTECVDRRCRKTGHAHPGDEFGLLASGYGLFARQG